MAKRQEMDGSGIQNRGSEPNCEAVSRNLGKPDTGYETRNKFNKDSSSGLSNWAW